MSFYTTLYNLLAIPPGSLVYHSVLVFSIVGTLQAAFMQWRTTEFPQAGRMVGGLSALLAGQVILFLMAGLAWQGVVDATMFLPPMERAILAASIAFAVWMWVFPEPARASDAAHALVQLVILIALAVSIVLRAEHPAGTQYNGSMQAVIWTIFSMAIAIGGIALLLARQPAGWTSGLSFLVIIFSGYLLEAIMPVTASDYSGMARLGMLAAFPLLFTLPQRFTFKESRRESRPTPARQTVSESDTTPNTDRRRYSTDPKTMHALLNLASELDATRINHHIARAVAQTMLADLCFLIYVSDDKNQLIIASGYDLIREEEIQGGLIPKDSIPMLANAVQKGKALRLPASSTSSDLKGLSDMLGLPSSGNLLSVPIMSEKNSSIGALLLISPYSSRQWTAEDQTFLTNITPAFVPVIDRGRRISGIEQERDRVQRQLEEAHSRATTLEEEKNALDARLESLEALVMQTNTTQDNGDEQRRLIEQLTKELEQLKTHGNEGAQSYYENELRLTLQEVARLQNSLAEANIRLMELENRSEPGKLSIDQNEVIASIAQELRQPMSSIVGYADLLLGESVGLLGALQRKFIERIKASTERIGSLIDDLIHITSLESGLKTLRAELVDLNLVIDNAMAYTSSQLREKNISLRIDLPKALTPIHADRESIQQILIHLLQNAGAASPVEGTVTLRVRLEKEEEQEYVLIQVADTGEGISEENLARVFSRLYRADNVLIEGIGDTGVGLSIAKSLTEAHNGRIWVESEPGKGATFSVLLPVEPNSIAAPKEE
jgi:signal transduction histidine kinase